MEAIDILLVEDNKHDASLALRALKKAHVANNIIHVKDGKEALDFIFGEGAFADRDTSVNPHLILLDLKLPKIDGLGVLRKIKADERTKSIPIVMLTSSKEDKDIVESYKLGVNSYIVKPIEFSKFGDCVRELGLYWMVLNEQPK